MNNVTDLPFILIIALVKIKECGWTYQSPSLNFDIAGRLFVYVYTSKKTHHKPVILYACMIVLSCKGIYIYIYMYMRVILCISICIGIYVCMCTQLNLWIYIYVCIRMYICMFSLSSASVYYHPFILITIICWLIALGCVFCIMCNCK